MSNGRFSVDGYVHETMYYERGDNGYYITDPRGKIFYECIGKKDEAQQICANLNKGLDVLNESDADEYRILRKDCIIRLGELRQYVETYNTGKSIDKIKYLDQLLSFIKSYFNEDR